MTTPAGRLRRALPPRPKGGYEPGTVAADTAAVLDDNERLDAQVAALRAALEQIGAQYLAEARAHAAALAALEALEAVRDAAALRGETP